MPAFPTARGWCLATAAIAFLVSSRWLKSQEADSAWTALRNSGIFSDRLFTLSAWFLLAAFALSLLLVSLASFLLSTRRPQSPKPELSFAAGCSSWEKTGWKIGLARLLPLVGYRVEWPEAPHLEARITGSGEEELRGLSRGLCHQAVRHLWIEDFLGLARSLKKVNEDKPRTVVHPAYCDLEIPRSESLLSASDDAHPEGPYEGDRTEMKQYVHGEPVRHMLWKIYARTGGQKMYVRIPEKTGERSFRLQFVPGPNDENAARLADFFIRVNPLGKEWTFSITGKDELWTANRVKEAREAVAASAAPGGSPPAAGVAISARDQACFMLLGSNLELVEKLAREVDPMLTIFLLATTNSDTSEEQRRAEECVKQLRNSGFPVDFVNLDTGQWEKNRS